jgi:hypothetical protein
VGLIISLVVVERGKVSVLGGKIHAGP